MSFDREFSSPILKSDVRRLEKEYNITLSKEYKNFIIKFANGGFRKMDELFSLEKALKLVIYYPKVYLSKKCKIYLSESEWETITKSYWEIDYYQIDESDLIKLEEFKYKKR